jgi:hypothetical protein
MRRLHVFNHYKLFTPFYFDKQHSSLWIAGHGFRPAINQSSPKNRLFIGT